jgi:hypothetical protein
MKPSNDNSDIKEGIQHIKPKSLKKKMEKQSNAWPVYYEHRELSSEEDAFM